jgi:hypothetical protein
VLAQCHTTQKLRNDIQVCKHLLHVSALFVTWLVLDVGGRGGRALHILIRINQRAARTSGMPFPCTCFICFRSRFVAGLEGLVKPDAQGSRMDHKLGPSSLLPSFQPPPLASQDNQYL